MHGFRVQGQVLQSWLMGFEYDSHEMEAMGSVKQFEAMFQDLHLNDSI